MLPLALTVYVCDACMRPAVWWHMPTWLRYLQWPSGLFVVGISWIWFVKIHRGVLKAIGWSKYA